MATKCIGIFLIVLLTCVLLSFVSQQTVQKVALSAATAQTSSLHFCSPRATARGSGQHVVSFNFYGQYDHPRRYFQGIEANARHLPSFYPGWTMRVYHAVQENDILWPIIHKLEKFYPHLDLCDVRKFPINGDLTKGQHNAWRFLALGDPQVSWFASRDLDSRCSAREVAAVEEWLKEGSAFHVMRDSGYHNKRMLAGMWDARKDLEPKLVEKISSELQKKILRGGPTGRDQSLLEIYVWPEIKGHVMQHDSYFCKNYLYRKNGNIHAWPTKRLNETNNYVGSVTSYNDIARRPCPFSCRPKDHKDWITC